MMVGRLKHSRCVEFGAPGFRVSGELRIGARRFPLSQFLEEQEYRTLGSRRAIDAEVRIRELEGLASDAEDLGRLEAAAAIRAEIVRIRSHGLVPAGVLVMGLLVALGVGLYVGRELARSNTREVVTVDQDLAMAWTEEHFATWCRSKGMGSDALQASAFLRAQASRSDVAICKAAIWLGEPGAAGSGIPRFVAAENLIRSFDCQTVEAAILRDAHHFGQSPEHVLRRLREAIGR